MQQKAELEGSNIVLILFATKDGRSWVLLLTLAAL